MSREINFAGGGVREIAALLPDGTLVSGCVDNADAADAAIAALGDKPRGVYITNNRVATLPVGRMLNPARLTCGFRVKNTDMEPRYVNLLFDYDAGQPKGVMSTDAELQVALDQAQSDREWLRSRSGLRLPYGISGSGVQMRPCVNLEATPENIRLVARTLAALKRRSSCIDVGRHALNQLGRYFGTMNRKGANSPERPWRMATVLEAGERTPVTREQLIAVCDAIGVPEAESIHAGVARPGSIDRQIRLLERWAEDYGFPPIQFVKEPDSKGAVTVVLEHCPRDESHNGTSAGMLFFPDGGRASCCHHNSCRSLTFREWWSAVEARLGNKLNFTRELIRR
jgi:hypothetical protein